MILMVLLHISSDWEGIPLYLKVHRLYVCLLCLYPCLYIQSNFAMCIGVSCYAYSALIAE